MPNIKIHWKGCPHHRLPRIRVASTPRNSVRTRSQLAAEQVLQVPLGKPLDQARKKQRINFRRFGRRRGRSSRSTGISSVVRSRRHASRRARHHIQAFGWGTSQAELASRKTFETASIRPHSSRSVVITSELRNQQRQDNAIPSTDGAASSSVRRVKAYSRDPEKLYSLVHVADVPAYLKTRNTKNQGRAYAASDRSSVHSPRRSGAEYAQIGPLETGSRQSPTCDSPTPDIRRTYDCRIDPKSRLEGRSKSGPSGIRGRTSGVRNIHTLKEKQNLSRVSTELWEAVNSLGLQSKPETPSNGTIVPSSRGTTISNSRSRTQSQRKGFKKFTRELELYLQACRSLPNGTLVATPSLTTISAHTIDELKPYQAQFQSAGLAVTSDQQKRLSRIQIEESPPPLPAKDEQWANLDLLGDGTMGIFRKDKQKEKPREPSYASGSTGTTVLGWTPPHEKNSSRPKIARQPSTDSDHTIIGFTPPHEKIPTRPPPAVPKVPSKKSLPWLRKPDSSPESVSPTNTINAASKAGKSQPTTPLEGWVATSDSPTRDKIVEKLKNSGPVVPPRPISKRSTKVEWNEVKCSKEKPAIDHFQQAEMRTQAGDIELAIVDTSFSTTYADMATQTDLDAVSHHPRVEDIAEITRAPILGARYKTFPLLRNKCKDDCKAASKPPQPQPKDVDQNRVESITAKQLPPLPLEVTSPKLCIKCAKDLKPKTPDSEPNAPQGEPKAKPDIEASSQSGLHTCPWNILDQISGPLEDIIPIEADPNPEEPEEDPGPTSNDHAEEEVIQKDENFDESSAAARVVKDINVEYTNQPPVADPMKRPSLPRLKVKSSTTYQPPYQRAQYATSSRSKSLPQASQPTMLVNLPTQLPDHPSASSLSTLGLRPSKVTDKQVFKGLHVATAAACDEDVDKWIEEITGCGVRNFLADLSRFEGLGVNTLADVARRAAKQRRERVRAWEVVREARVAQVDGQAGAKGPGEKGMGTEEQMNWVIGEMGVIASDGVEELGFQVVHSRGCKGSDKGRRDACCE